MQKDWCFEVNENKLREQTGRTKQKENKERTGLFLFVALSKKIELTHKFNNETI